MSKQDDRQEGLFAQADPWARLSEEMRADLERAAEAYRRLFRIALREAIDQRVTPSELRYLPRAEALAWYVAGADRLLSTSIGSPEGYAMFRAFLVDLAGFERARGAP